MLRSGLYGVLNHAMQASGNGSIFFLEIGNYNYRVEQKVDSTGDNYFIIHLPYSEHNKTLNLSHGEYRLNESHFTVYEAQGNEGGVYRPHFTGNYTDESKHQTLRLRGYVGDGDGVCIGNMRATTSKTSKKKGRTTTDIADFFDDALDKTRFKNHLLGYISPLMIHLRATQYSLNISHEQRYQDLLSRARQLNRTYTENPSIEVLKACQDVTIELVEVTLQLVSISEDSAAWVSAHRIHQQQLDDYSAQLHAKENSIAQQVPKHDQEHTSETKLDPMPIEKLSATDSNSMSDEAVWQPHMIKVSEILSTTPSRDSARELIIEFNNLTKAFDPNITLAKEVQYQYLDLQCAVTKYLADLCYQALLHDADIDIITEFSAQLPRAPLAVVESLIRDDKADEINILLSQNLLSIYDLANDGRPLYTYAYDEPSLNCITLYAQYGIHPILSLANKISPILSSSTINLRSLRKILTNYDHINLHLQRMLGVSEWIVLLDNLLRTLRNTRHDLLYAGHGSHRTKITKNLDSTKLLDLIISTLEIPSMIMKVFSAEDLIKIQGRISTISLKPLLDMMPEGVNSISLNLVKLLVSLHPMKDILTRFKQCIKNLNPAQRESLRDLSMSYVKDYSNPQDTFMSGYTNSVIQSMYQSLLKNPSLSGYSRKMKVSKALSIIAENIESGAIMAPPQMTSSGRSEIIEYVRSLTQAEMTSQQDLINHIKSEMNFTERDGQELIQAFMEAGRVLLEGPVSSTQSVTMSSLLANSIFSGLMGSSDELTAASSIREALGSFK